MSTPGRRPYRTSPLQKILREAGSKPDPQLAYFTLRPYTSGRAWQGLGSQIARLAWPGLSGDFSGNPLQLLLSGRRAVRFGVIHQTPRVETDTDRPLLSRPGLRLPVKTRPASLAPGFDAIRSSREFLFSFSASGSKMPLPARCSTERITAQSSGYGFWTWRGESLKRGMTFVLGTGIIGDD